MSDHDDERLDGYLWDPGTEPEESVHALERRLAAYRFDPDRAPLTLPSPPAVRPVRRLQSARPWWPRLALAAMLLLAVGTSLATWRWSWPAGRAWLIEAAPAGAPDRLAVGSTLRIPRAAQAVIDVARIGTLRLAGDSALTLRATRSNRHRLTLEHGSVHVRVWAPPFSVVFQTPAGTVGDVGCEFDLQVDAAASRVRVRSGWVQLENALGETLVPAGASGEMLTGREPGVPVYQDAPRSFLDAVRALEQGRTQAGDAVDRIVTLARPRDVLTLLLLVHRGAEGRERLAARAAELWPPPGGVTVDHVLRGDDEAFWRWHNTLPLPPVKSWWWNWRDALPQWLVSDRR
jgi:FecR-like protein